MDRTVGGRRSRCHAPRPPGAAARTAWVLALTAFACGRGTHGGARPSEAPVATGHDEAIDAAAVATRMRGQFVDGNALKDALVTGRVAVVNEVAARFVARHREEPFPVEWQPQVDPFMEWAQAAAAADDFEAAAVAVANVSARCGECHRSEEVELQLPAHAEPESAAQMQRYRFAIDRMWEGLVMPDAARWQQGARAYASAVDCNTVGDGAAVPAHHRAPCNSILAVAGAARSATTMQARADAFAAVTFSCAGCHGADLPMESGSAEVASWSSPPWHGGVGLTPSP